MPIEEITRRGILVADTSPHMASLVTQMLRALGRKDIREAYDATRAMAELKRRPFQVLVLDADLAGMDGAAFARRLRADANCPNRTIPIIMMSAAPDAQRITEARDAGVTEFLRKPFSASHLRTRLTSIETNPRDFIDADSYAGPDRRRKSLTPAQEKRTPLDKSRTA